ncbi:MAG: hypothetical protein ACLGIK_12160 [Gemmatimonadota bacterium]
MTIDVDVTNARFGDVLRNVSRAAGVLVVVASPDILEERVTVSLREIPWNEAVAVICRMVIKTAYVYPHGAFIDWGCSDFDPGSLENALRVGIPAR